MDQKEATLQDIRAYLDALMRELVVELVTQRTIRDALAGYREFLREEQGQ